MTKTDLLAGPVRWHDIADLHLAVGDDHSVDQELHQGPSLIEGRLGQTLPHPLAEVLNGAGKPGELLVSVCLGLELSRLFLKLALGTRSHPPVSGHLTGWAHLAEAANGGTCVTERTGFYASFLWRG